MHRSNSSFLSFRIGMALMGCKVRSSCWKLAGAIYLFSFFSRDFILLFFDIDSLSVGVAWLLILLLYGGWFIFRVLLWGVYISGDRRAKQIHI